MMQGRLPYTCPISQKVHYDKKVHDIECKAHQSKLDFGVIEA